MKTTHLIAALVGLLAMGIFAADASAFYHPGMGSWMQRDPGAGGPIRVGANGAAPIGKFIPQDQYQDGMNLYEYVKSNPTNLIDPSGLDAWYTSNASHAGYKVEVRDSSGCLKGCLSVDYHAQGYMGDDGPARSSGHALFGEQGRVQLSYKPGKCEATSLRVTGKPDQDSRLVDWSLKAAGQDSTWISDYDKEKAGHYDAKNNNEGKWSKYTVLGNRTCVNFAYAGIKVYLGQEWWFNHGWNTVEGSQPESLASAYEGNFDQDGNYTGEANRRRQEEHEQAYQRFIQQEEMQRNLERILNGQ